MTTQTQAPRVSYSYSLKVPGKEAYSSVSVSLSLSIDVEPDESKEQAMERARAFVRAEAAKDLPQPPAPGRKSIGVENELFDPNNPVHLTIAKAVFDDVGVKSEKSREYKVKYMFPGKRIADLARIVQDDQAAFRAKQRGGA